MVFETKSSKRGILDLLKSAESDSNLDLLIKELNLEDKQHQPNMSLFDQILAIILDYLKCLSTHPEVFELEECQHKEFNKWKQDILHHVCQLLHQIQVALNILIRRKPDQLTQAEF